VPDPQSGQRLRLRPGSLHATRSWHAGIRAQARSPRRASSPRRHHRPPTATESLNRSRRTTGPASSEQAVATAMRGHGGPASPHAGPAMLPGQRRVGLNRDAAEARLASAARRPTSAPAVPPPACQARELARSERHARRQRFGIVLRSDLFAARPDSEPYILTASHCPDTSHSQPSACAARSDPHAFGVVSG